MFYARRYIEYLESDIAKKANRIADLERLYSEIVERTLFHVTPPRILADKIAQEKEWRAKAEVKTNDAPQDAVSAAETRAWQKTQEKFKLKQAE